ANNNLLVPVGEQRTDGLELSVLGRLAQGLDLTAGYAFMDGRITKSNSVSSGVAIEGNRSSLTPEHSANLWLTKRFNNGFGIGGGAVYMGEQFASSSNLVKLPGYTRFDAAAFYETRKYDIRLAVNNIFDKRYFISAHGGADLYNTPGAPMNALLSLRLKF
ncbi:MAG: TonB-dependent receptor, partial [Candidatus Methylopumilus sp.]